MPTVHARLLTVLRGQVDAITSMPTRQLSAIVAVFACMTESECELRDLLKYYPKHPDLVSCKKSLARLLDYLDVALDAAGTPTGLGPKAFTSQQIRTLCNGLAACASVPGSLLFLTDEHSLATLGKLNDILLVRALKSGVLDAVQADGEVLDILKWLGRGLKADVLHASEPVKRYFETSLVLIHAWTASDQPRQLPTVYDLSRCAVQIATIITHDCIDLQAAPLDGRTGCGKVPEPVQTNAAMLQQCVLQLCSPAVLRRLATAPTDTVALLSICNMVKYAMEKGLLAMNDALLPGLYWLVQAIGKLPEHELIGVKGDCQALSNFANFLRRLAEIEARHQSALRPVLAMCDPVCHSLIACINSDAFKAADPGSQSLTNLISFVKLCDKRLERRNAGITAIATTLSCAATSSTDAVCLTQAELVEAAGRLIAGVLQRGTRYFDNPQALGGLLAGLAYMWQRNLAPLTSATAVMVGELLDRIDHIRSGSWNDKSKKVVLPAVKALLQLGLLSPEQAQRAWTRILPASGAGTGQLTLQHMARDIARLGANEDAVIALPMALHASVTKAILPISPAPIREKPDTPPGWTRIVEAPQAVATSSSTASTAKRYSTADSTSASATTTLRESSTQRDGFDDEFESAPYDPSTISASMPAYMPYALKGAEQAQVRKHSPAMHAGHGKKAVKPATAKANKGLAFMTKKPVSSAAGKAGQDHAQVALVAAILAGQSTEVVHQFQQKANWSNEDIGGVLDDVTSKLELIDKTILGAMQAFFTAVRQALPKTGAEVLTCYFALHPANFAALQKLLAEQGLVPGKVDAIAYAEVKLPAADVEATALNQNGANALTVAVLNGQVDIVRLLLAMPSADSQANAIAMDGMNALMYATAQGRVEIVGHLLTAKSANAQALAVNKDRSNALTLAIGLGHVRIVEQLLALKSADDQAIAVDQNAANALMKAVLKGDVDIVRLLLAMPSADSQANAIAMDGMNALMYATAQGRVEIVRQLLTAKSANAQALAANKNKFNALALAAGLGHGRIVEQLLALESAFKQTQAVSTIGFDALAIAVANGYTEIVRQLHVFLGGDL